MDSISVILPAFDDSHNLKSQLESLNNQTLLPKEVIIVDSSSDNKVEDLINLITSTVQIKYFRIGRGFKFDRYLFLLSRIFHFLRGKYDFSNTRAYPSEAINYGANKASGEILAFIDMSTLPDTNWLEDYVGYLNKSNDVVFGVTQYQYKTNIQKLIHFSTFGFTPRESNPGSLVWKTKYLSNKVLEGYRSGVDLEWRNRIRECLKTFTPKKKYLVYNSLSLSVSSFLRKMFVYQMHSVPLKIQKNTKDIVFALFLIFLSLTLSRWNYLVGWNSFFYIPHVTKIFLIIINLFFLQLLLFRRIGFDYLSKSKYPFVNTIFQYIVFFSLFLLTYRWNAIAAEWIESSRYYIPHLTKIFLVFSIFLVIIYRGLVFPLKNGIKMHELSIGICIKSGFVGLLGDIVKAPGFIIGSIFYLFSRNTKN
jgi:glycosyltransferase involved in cell wall biosynthesis